MFLRLLAAFQHINFGDVNHAEHERVENLCISALQRNTNKEFNLAAGFLNQIFNNPELIPALYKKPILIMVMQHQYWSLANLNPSSKSSLKKQTFELIKSSEMNIALNASLQALCSETFLGKILFMQRYMTSPSITAGTLQLVASFLERMFERGTFKEVNIAPETIIAIKREVQLNPMFNLKLRGAYPSLYTAIQNILSVGKLKEINLHDQGNRFIGNDQL